jgi:hypothetical protein
VWVAGAGALAGRSLLAGAALGPALPLAAGVAVAAVPVGRLFRAPRSGMALALSALPLWATGGCGVAIQLGLPGTAVIAGGLVATAAGGLAAAAAADEGVALAAGLLAATVPWAVTLGLCAWLREGVALGAAVLTPGALTTLRLLPWVVVRLTRLDGEPAPATLPARTAGARRLLGTLTAGTAVTLGGACVVLAVDPSWWARAMAMTAAAAALLHARRRRFAVEVVPLWLVALATLATFELELTLARPDRLDVLVGTAAGLVALALVGRRVRLPVGIRRQLERLEAVTAAATGPLAFGLLGIYDAAARFAGRFT